MKSVFHCIIKLNYSIKFFPLTVQVSCSKIKIMDSGSVSDFYIPLNVNYLFKSLTVFSCLLHKTAHI